MEKPPVIAPPVNKRRRRTLLYILLALGVPVVLLAVLFCLAWPRPPKEKDLLQSFHRNRATFEELRDMLRADVNLRRVAGWG